MTVRRATYTITEAAARLGVSTWTIRKEIAEGNLPTVPFSGRVTRIPASAVERFVEAAR